MENYRVEADQLEEAVVEEKVPLTSAAMPVGDGEVDENDADADQAVDAANCVKWNKKAT